MLNNRKYLTHQGFVEWCQWKQIQEHHQRDLIEIANENKWRLSSKVSFDGCIEHLKSIQK